MTPSMKRREWICPECGSTKPPKAYTCPDCKVAFDGNYDLVEPRHPSMNLVGRDEAPEYMRDDDDVHGN